MQKKDCKFSIITINLNNEVGLKKTIESVIKQNYRNFEFLVIDGGSIDGSVDEIKRIESSLSYWVSEPDKGIYDAMNKGIKFATGTYCLFLNSGDCLYSKNILSDFINSSVNQDIVIGNSIVITNFEEELHSSPIELNFRYLSLFNIPHQATFIKRALFTSVGLYNCNNYVVSDWEFILKAICLHNSSYRHLDIVISICEPPGISRSIENIDRIKLERERAMYDNLKYIWAPHPEIQKLFSTNVGHLYIYICNHKFLFLSFSRILKLVVFFRTKIINLLKNLGYK
jgi:glycosyltransferase involved in cell wall biosynthesis